MENFLNSNINPSYMQQKEPIWVSIAKKNYFGANIYSNDNSNIGHSYTETNIARGNLSNAVLENKVLPSSNNEINVLLIGAGVNNGSISSYGSSEPYKISGFLESKDFDYKMTIVDKDPEVILDIKNRKNIFFLNSTYDNYKWFRDEWDSFLRITRQNDEFVYELTDGIIFSDHYFKQEDFINKCFKLGFRKAKIPTSFSHKLKNGDVDLINSDIATVDLSKNKYFDFVSCVNVLYLLSSYAQKLALFNIANNTKKGGYILINDLGFDGTPLLPRQGGWFNKSKHEELSLVVDDIIKSENELQTVLFRKK
jgi:hypothetical protein